MAADALVVHFQGSLVPLAGMSPCVASLTARCVHALKHVMDSAHPLVGKSHILIINMVWGECFPGGGVVISICALSWCRVDAELVVAPVKLYGVCSSKEGVPTIVTATNPLW